MFTSTELKAHLREDVNVTPYELIGLMYNDVIARGVVVLKYHRGEYADNVT
jgi:hypothetical protein